MRPNQVIAQAVSQGFDAFLGERERLRQLDRQTWQDQMAREDQARQAKQFEQQQAAQARNQYIQELEFGAKQAEALLSQGQHERAASLYNDLASRGQAHGFNLGAPVAGGTKLVPDGPAVGTGKEQLRPNLSMFGPMPEQMRQPMKPVKDFGADGTVAAIRGGLGLTPPKPQYETLSQGSSLVDPRTGKVVITAPYAENPYKVEASDQIRLKEAGLTNALTLAQLRAAAALERTAMAQAGADRRATARRTASDDDPGALARDAKAIWNKPFPVDRTGPAGMPDGIADNYPGTPIDQAVPAWNQGFNTVLDSLQRRQAPPAAAPSRPAARPATRSRPAKPTADSVTKKFGL